MGWDEDNDNPRRPGANNGPADLDALVKDFQLKLSGLFGGRRGGGGPGPGDRVLATVVVLAAAVWALSGFYKIDAAENGVVLRFGDYQATTGPGLRWHLPWPIETVEKINTSRTETWSYQGSMLTRDENIVIVDLIVQYRRSDPVEYLFSVQDPESTLRDITASAIREVVGKNELDFILTEGRSEVAAQTQRLLQSTLDAYETGITVFEVNLQEANFPQDVESAVQDAVKAREDRERAILRAEEYSNEILPRARGAAARRMEDAEAYRARTVADAEGESDRFLKILNAYAKAPEVTRQRLYIETLEEILANSTKILVDTEGGNNLLYLPLDQLIQQRDIQQRDAPNVEEVPPAKSVAAAGLAPNNARERTAR